MSLVNQPSSGTCVLPELPVVLDGDVAALLELEGGIHGELFASRLTEGLGPARLAWVPLLFEQLMALGPAELEDLQPGPREGLGRRKCHKIWYECPTPGDCPTRFPGKTFPTRNFQNIASPDRSHNVRQE